MKESNCSENQPGSSPRKAPKPYSKEALSLQEGQIYEHYKGYRYQIVSASRDSETLEEKVVYRALYGERDVWVRPLEMFFETVVIDGNRQPRFRLISK